MRIANCDAFLICVVSLCQCICLCMARTRISMLIPVFFTIFALFGNAIENIGGKRKEEEEEDIDRTRKLQRELRKMQIMDISF